MAVIRVPKPPKRAFDKSRPPSSLLRSQIEHLEWATKPKSRGKVVGGRAKSIRTEGEAAAYIEELTRRLHPEGAELKPEDAPRSSEKRPKTADAVGRSSRSRSKTDRGRPKTRRPVTRRRARGRRSG